MFQTVHNCQRGRVKLFYSPFACSLASHIATREAQLGVDLVRVELETKKKVGGGLLFDDNPMGQVPTLVLDDGRVLTENVAVLSYLGDRMAPEARGDRYEMTRWLSFVATELHKKLLAPIFAPNAQDVFKTHARAAAPRALATAEGQLASRETLLGGLFSAADAYLFWALTLMPHAEIPLDPYPALQRFHATHLKRPAVREALSYEKKERETPFVA